MMQGQLKQDEFQEEQKERQPLRLVEKTKIQNSFYRIIHPDKLAVIGGSYLEDFRKGTKSFAICSTNYKTSQQRTILALASYFEQLFDVKILIVSDTLMKGAFRPLVEAGKKEKKYFLRPELAANIIRFYHHFDFMEMNEIIREHHVWKLQELVQEYDLVLWDTPLLGQHHDAQGTLQKIAGFIQSYSMIVPPNSSHRSQSEELKRHFDGFGININGVLFREVYKGRD
jgi:hypothetical protein